LKPILSILFAALILFQSNSKVWIVVLFKLNQEYISSKLCTYRDQPLVLCSGKCVLEKVLTSDAKQEKEVPQKLKELEAAPSFLPGLSFFKLQPSTDCSELKKAVFAYQAGYSNPVKHDWPDPPECHLA